MSELAVLTHRPIAEGLVEITRDYGVTLPTDKTVAGLSVEKFQSDLFRRALGWETGRKDECDGLLITLTYNDNTQSVVLKAKFVMGTPYALMANGTDLRQHTTAIYEWDGGETITEHALNVDANIYTGEHDGPKRHLLPHLRNRLGRCIRAEQFV